VVPGGTKRMILEKIAPLHSSLENKYFRVFHIKIPKRSAIPVYFLFKICIFKGVKMRFLVLQVFKEKGVWGTWYYTRIAYT